MCIIIHICDVMHIYHAECSDLGEGRRRNSEIRDLYMLVL